ncbi:hypothetical protein GCM10023086_67690 [Streptomyces venetus]|uniref:UmuC domain-containing protein n=1 Tax=Streptomyces venetus TaxID=1701086 RepID=A0ABP8H707_9ACTN
MDFAHACPDITVARRPARRDTAEAVVGAVTRSRQFHPVGYGWHIPGRHFRTTHARLRTLTLADDLTITRMGYGAMQLAGPGVFGPPKDRRRDGQGGVITSLDPTDLQAQEHRRRRTDPARQLDRGTRCHRPVTPSDQGLVGRWPALLVRLARASTVAGLHRDHEM